MPLDYLRSGQPLFYAFYQLCINVTQFQPISAGLWRYTINSRQAAKTHTYNDKNDNNNNINNNNTIVFRWTKGYRGQARNLTKPNLNDWCLKPPKNPIATVTTYTFKWVAVWCITCYSVEVKGWVQQWCQLANAQFNPFGGGKRNCFYFLVSRKMRYLWQNCRETRFFQYNFPGDPEK